ncbi:uncharacterized protein LOC125777616 [Bactrocera dorsalis]|uniref:Uncharacterized protein LOC125777616 n=1 Tax=Bactrocera dorsalis TaxID=27457 RepID=A0ABM3JHF7_BACDO|nr:uncharacterized protein LOC125777616 [Bactrocera dorsalis]
MPKEYKQKCRDVWLKSDEFKAWIRRDDTDQQRVYCNYCKSTITAKLSDLRAHAATKKHTSAMSGFTQANKLNFARASENYNVQIKEASLCLFIAQHTAMTQIDHLGSLCKKWYDEANINLQRTKCTNILKNVLGPHFSEDLCRNYMFGFFFFSILPVKNSFFSWSKVGSTGPDTPQFI